MRIKLGPEYCNMFISKEDFKEELVGDSDVTQIYSINDWA